LDPTLTPRTETSSCSFVPKNSSSRTLDISGKGALAKSIAFHGRRSPLAIPNFSRNGPGRLLLKFPTPNTLEALPRQIHSSERSVTPFLPFISDIFSCNTQLNTVYKALAGNMLGCVEFYGFTKVPIDRSNNICTLSASSLSSFKFALVFDYASEGPLLNHLEKAFQLGQPVGNWKIICDAMHDLANGLRTIHQQGIIHR
jgi:hypothetical protein